MHLFMAKAPTLVIKKTRPMAAWRSADTVGMGAVCGGGEVREVGWPAHFDDKDGDVSMVFLSHAMRSHPALAPHRREGLSNTTKAPAPPSTGRACTNAITSFF